MLWWWSWCGLCCPCLGFPLVRELQRALRAFPPRSLAVGGCAHTTCRHHTFYAGRRQFLWRCICRRLFNLRALWDLVWHQATTRQLFRIGDGASPSLCSHMCDVDGSLAAVPLQAPSLDGSGIWLLLLPLDTIHSLPAFLIGRLPFPHIIPSALYHPTFHFLVLLVHFCGCSLTFYTLPCFSSPISFFVKLHDPLSNPPPPGVFSFSLNSPHPLLFQATMGAGFQYTIIYGRSPGSVGCYLYPHWESCSHFGFSLHTCTLCFRACLCMMSPGNHLRFPLHHMDCTSFSFLSLFSPQGIAWFSCDFSLFLFFLWFGSFHTPSLIFLIQFIQYTSLTFIIVFTFYSPNLVFVI